MFGRTAWTPGPDIEFVIVIIIISDQKFLTKGSIAVLSPFAAANEFVRPWPWPHPKHASLGPRESAPKWHLDRFSHFWQGLQTWPTDTQTDRPRYSVCNSRPLSLAIAAVRPDINTCARVNGLFLFSRLFSFFFTPFFQVCAPGLDRPKLCVLSSASPYFRNVFSGVPCIEFYLHSLLCNDLSNQSTCRNRFSPSFWISKLNSFNSNNHLSCARFFLSFKVNQHVHVIMLISVLPATHHVPAISHCYSSENSSHAATFN